MTTTASSTESTAVPRRGQDPRAPAAAEVFVVFGSTGDLAEVMTFESLYKLERRGLLNGPIVGVAVDDWLAAALRGDSMQFTQQAAVEETWRIVQPLLDAPPPMHPYKPGSWGPEAAEQLVAGHGGWHGPWLAQ